MKKYIKFSDERNRRYSIKTIIGENNGEKYVLKEPIYPEGQQHMEIIMSNYSLLLDYYDVRPCKSWRLGDGVAFEYIEGESLTHMYLQAISDGDKESYKRILDAHKNIIIGKGENMTFYQSNDSFQEIFGLDDMFDGCPALKCSNFDAISSNVIYRENVPVFIDYEWIYDFVIPIDLVIYHCVADMYLHDSSFEEFMPLDEVLEYLGLQLSRDVLQKAVESFHRYIISEGKDESYALVKAICLKNIKNLNDILHEMLICQCEIDRLQGVITDANSNLLEKQEEIGHLNTKLYNTEMSKMEEVASLNARLYNLEVEKANSEFELDNVKKELEKVATELGEIHTSIAWKIIDKCRKKK